MHGRAAYAGETLGNFIVSHRWSALAPDVVHEGKRALLNFFGCAMGVADDPAVAAALRVMQPFSGVDVVTVIGSASRLDPMAASFVNAIAANLLDFDDTHLRTVIHPSAPVAPPVLAVAEQRHLSTRSALHAFVLGAEIACRIGNAVSPGHYARGWHITATCGVFGAAAGSARLLGLTAAQAGTSLGIAASQSAGVIENLTTAAKNIGVGNAARNGLLAAMFAQQGYTAAPAAIEGPLGWARAMGDTPVAGEMVDDLGERWELLSNTYKPYPAGIVMHALIDACLTLREHAQFRVDQVQRVDVSGSQLLLARGERDVNNERDARVSIQHCAAIALLRGRAGVDEFTRAAVADAAVAALRKRVFATLDPGLPVGACRVSVTRIDGTTETVLVEHARGSAAKPLSDGDLEAKFRDNAHRGGAGGDADRQIEAIWRMDEERDTAALMRLMAAR